MKRLIFALTLAAAWGGCAHRAQPPVAVNNVYRAPVIAWPARVAVLPISVPAGHWAAAEGSHVLQSVLIAELAKQERFETVSVTQEQLDAWTGHRTWRLEETLPHNFFDKLRDELGCDGVLFTHLSSYHPYEPMVLGWRIRLVDAHSTQITWAADEVFDAGRKTTAHAAERYGRATDESWLRTSRDEVLLSPRRFAQYSFSALFETLPQTSQ